MEDSHMFPIVLKLGRLFPESKELHQLPCFGLLCKFLFGLISCITEDETQFRPNLNLIINLK